MNNLIKKLFILTSVLGVVFLMSACSSSTSSDGTSRDIQYAQTNQYSDVTSVSADMYQRNAKKESMGIIRFTETTAGLSMLIELKDVRPGVEYKMYVYERTECGSVPGSNKNPRKNCEKVKMGFTLPTIKGEKDGTVKNTYIITGLAASELVDTRITLNRDNKQTGKEVTVGWGKLEK